MSNSAFSKSTLRIFGVILLVYFTILPVKGGHKRHSDRYNSGRVIMGVKTSSKLEYRLLVLAPGKPDYSRSPMSLNSTLVALQMSIEKLLVEWLPQFYFEVSFFDTECDYQKNSLAPLIIFSDNDVHSFFGPMCSTLMPMVSVLSRHYGLNSMSIGCHSTGDMNPAVVRLMPPYAYISESEQDPKSSSSVDAQRPDMFYAVKQTVAYFGWEMQLACLYSADDALNNRDDLNLATIWSFIHDWRLTSDNGIDDYLVGLPYTVKNMRIVLGSLDEKKLAFSTWTRVLVIGLQPQFLRQFLYIVFYKKKFKIEEYAILYLDNNYMIGNNFKNQPWRDPYLEENHPINQIMKKIFRHVLIFRHQNLFAGNMTRYESVRDEFLAACKASNFSNCELPGKPEYIQYVAATYDGIKLLMQSVNKTFGTGLYDNLLPYVRKKTFLDKGFAANPYIVFNQATQRVVPMNVLRMEDTVSGNFSVHITYNVDGSKVIKGPGVPWISGAAPQNPPGCGYFCSKPNYLKYLVIIAGIGVVVLVIMMLTGGFYVYRRVKFEKELMKMTWVINSAELEHTQTEESSVQT